MFTKTRFAVMHNIIIYGGIIFFRQKGVSHCLRLIIIVTYNYVLAH